MSLIRFLIIIIALLFHLNISASDKFDWMESAVDGVGSYISGCINVPKFANVDTSSTTLNLKDSGKWVNTGVQVDDDKLLELQWSAQPTLSVPKKYKVLYRIDPRFDRPQVFIQERVSFKDSFGREQEIYISDFHRFYSGKLMRYQNNPDMELTTRGYYYNSYFNFYGRSKIPVKVNDVVIFSIANDEDRKEPTLEPLAKLIS